jgi:hypothetical protein
MSSTVLYMRTVRDIVSSANAWYCLRLNVSLRYHFEAGQYLLFARFEFRKNLPYLEHAESTGDASKVIMYRITRCHCGRAQVISHEYKITWYSRVTSIEYRIN